MTDEEELIGDPLEEVPQREPDDHCNGRRKQSRDGELVEDDEGRKIFAGYCQLVSGWGTDGDHGRCRKHGGSGGSGGARDGAGAGEGNTNAVTHALYTQSNRFYQHVIGDDLRDLCDQIFESYVSLFEDANERPPVVGEQARLSEIAVNHIKIIHADNWAVDKPEGLDSGNALIDRETRIKTSQHDMHEEVRYKETPIVKTQQRLRKEDRAWLKEYNMLGVEAIAVSVDGSVDHDHEHGLDDDLEEIIADLSKNLRV